MKMQLEHPRHTEPVTIPKGYPRLGNPRQVKKKLNTCKFPLGLGFANRPPQVALFPAFWLKFLVLARVRLVGPLTQEIWYSNQSLQINSKVVVILVNPNLFGVQFLPAFSFDNAASIISIGFNGAFSQ
jgi:hypothetical protein